MRYNVTVSSQDRGLDAQGWINANATVYQIVQMRPGELRRE